MSYKLHEHESAAAWKSLKAQTRSLTVPSANSSPPLLNIGRKSWSYSATTASTPYASIMECHAAQLGNPPNRSGKAAKEDTTTCPGAVHKLRKQNLSSNLKPPSRLIGD